MKHCQNNQSTHMNISYKSFPEYNMKYDNAVSGVDYESDSIKELF